MIKGKFVVLIGANTYTYTNFEDIPDTFDNLIEFSPEIKPGPHTHEEHEEIGLLASKLQELMKREQR